MRLYRQNAFVGAAVLSLQLSLSGAVYADDQFQVFAGADITEKTDAQFGFLGANAFLDGNAQQGGTFLSFIGGISHYDYDNNSVPGGVVDGYVSSGVAFVGYKAVDSDVSMTGQLGVEYRRRDLSPDDPFSDAEGKWLGAKVALEGTIDPANGIFANAFGEYSTINDSKYGLLRIGPSYESVAVGPEIAWVGEDGWGLVRYGAFARIDMSSDLVVNFAGGNAKNTEGSGGEGYYLSAKFEFDL